MCKIHIDEWEDDQHWGREGGEEAGKVEVVFISSPESFIWEICFEVVYSLFRLQNGHFASF